MKNRIGIIIGVIICLALVVAVITIKQQATRQKENDTETILTLSNKWVDTSGKLDEQKQVTAMLEKDLDGQKKSFGDLTNDFSRLSTEKAQIEANLAKTQTEYKDEVAKRDAKITELESQNEALDKQAIDLSASITNLNLQIAETQKKLVASEGDKTFLEGELKRMIAEKAELERQFNDLTVVRAQVSKLKEELAVARRLEWIRQGLYANSEQKGAQKLMQGFAAPQVAQARSPKGAYDLNVEVGADGSVKVIPPLTNAPPAK